MEQNGTSNGQDAKPHTSPTASGANKSPKKRRKVNHGRSMVPATWYTIFKACADHGTCSCSLCILSTICKSSIGLEYKGWPWSMRLCAMSGMS